MSEVQLGRGLSLLAFVQVQVLYLWGLCLCVCAHAKEVVLRNHCGWMAICFSRMGSWGPQKGPQAASRGGMCTRKGWGPPFSV